MPKLVLFADQSFNGNARIYTSNDPNLVLNGEDMVFASAIVVDGEWTLYDDTGFAGASVNLGTSGGPDSDGVFRDHADWGGEAPFHVRSISR